MDEHVTFSGVSFVTGVFVTIILFCVGFIGTDLQNIEDDKAYWNDGKCIECQAPLSFNKKTKEGYVFECSIDTNHEKLIVHAVKTEMHNY